MTSPGTLSPRALSIADHVANGLTNKQIALVTGLTAGAVDYHVERLARVWNLDFSKEIRVQITRRVLGAA